MVYTSWKKIDLGGSKKSIWGVDKYLHTMFPYTEKCTESETDIQNNDLSYKLDQQCQNTFDIFEKQKNENIRKTKINFLFCNIYKLHNSYFVMFGFFVNFVILVFLDFYIRRQSGCQVACFGLPGG